MQKMPSIIVDPRLPPPPPPKGQVGATATGNHASSSKVAPPSADNIGSFRADREWEDALPSTLRNLLGKNGLHDTLCFVVS